jgi:hypothetical protein
MNSSNEVVKLTHCKSCDFKFESYLKFCPDCGGKVIRERLTIKTVFNEFIQNLFNVDSKFIQTLKDLVVQPEQVFKSFIEGGRKKYYHPVSLLAIAILLSALSATLLPFDEIINSAHGVGEKGYELGYKGAGGSEESFQEALKDEENRQKFEESRKKMDQFQKKYNDFILNNSGLIQYIMIPFYALIAYLVFLNKKLYNFAEMVTVVLYQNAFTTFISFFSILIFYLLDWNMLIVTSLSFISIFLYSNYSFQRLFKLSAVQLIFANLRFFLISIPIIIFLLIIMTVAVSLIFLI